MAAAATDALQICHAASPVLSLFCSGGVSPPTFVILHSTFPHLRRPCFGRFDCSPDLGQRSGKIRWPMSGRASKNTSNAA